MKQGCVVIERCELVLNLTRYFNQEISVRHEKSAASGGIKEI